MGTGSREGAREKCSAMRGGMGARTYKISSFIFILFITILLPLSGNAVYDPPHTEASGVTCADCHGASVVIAGGSPFWTDNKADSAYNALCLTRCHTIDKVPPRGPLCFSDLE